jgi:hypothetical protein
MADFAVNIIVAAKDAASAVLKNVGASMSRMSGGVSGMGAAMFNIPSVAGLATKALGAFGIGLSAASMVKFSLDTMKMGKELKDLSYTFGESAETLGKWKYIASVDGMEFDKFTGAIRKMSDALGEALVSGGDSVFNQMGLDVQKLALQGTDGVLNSVADALSHIDNSAVRTKYATDVFGKSVLDILPLLKDGSAGLKGMADEGQRFGAILSNIEVEKLDYYSVRFNKLKENAAGVGRKGAVKGEGGISDFFAYPGALAYFVGHEAYNSENPQSFRSYWEYTRPSAVADRAAKAQIAQDEKDRKEAAIEESRKSMALAMKKQQETARQEYQDALDAQNKPLSDLVVKWKTDLKSPFEKFQETKGNVVSALYRKMIDPSFADIVLEDAATEYQKTLPSFKEPKTIIGETAGRFNLLESRTARFSGGGINPVETLMQKQVRLLETLTDQGKRQLDLDERDQVSPFKGTIRETDFR